MDPDAEDKQWATKYLLDPLTAPQPSDETGPGSHFVREHSTAKTPALTATSKRASATAYPTPPSSASPTRSSFRPRNLYSAGSHRQATFEGYSNGDPSRQSPDQLIGNGKGRRRGSSLGERYPGDMSHRPLDVLRKEAKAADRAPHLNKKHMPGADSIDVLDRTTVGGAYHHEGPYDATLLARNTSYKISPVEATKGSNYNAIRATPRYNIKDSLDKHVPLQGTAVIPPGFAGLDGREMNYEEGADLMREEDAPGGAYKRWEGIKYLPDDFKGKGEPSFSIEKALKEHEIAKHRRAVSDSKNTYEMQPTRHLRPAADRQRSISGDNVHADQVGAGKLTGTALKYKDFESDMRRSNSTGEKITEGLKRRFGSLRRSRKATASEA